MAVVAGIIIPGFALLMAIVAWLYPQEPPSTHDDHQRPGWSTNLPKLPSQNGGDGTESVGLGRIKPVANPGPRRPDRDIRAVDIIRKWGGIRGNTPSNDVASRTGVTFKGEESIDLAPGNGPSGIAVPLPAGAHHFVGMVFYNTNEACTQPDKDLYPTYFTIYWSERILDNKTIGVRDPDPHPISIDLSDIPANGTRELRITTTPAGSNRACCQVVLSDARFTFD
jgi:hypothetical protein